jgi:hypothetical protein
MQVLAFACKEDMRKLQEHSGAIAGLGIAAYRSTVGKISENRHSVVNDLVRTLTINISNKADAARIVFIPWIIEPFLFHADVFPRKC